jgi:hypothetical protein
MLSRFNRGLLPRIAGFLILASHCSGVWGPAALAEAGDFEIDRFDRSIANQFDAFDVQETKSLSDALSQGALAPETWVLVTDTAAGPLALLTEQMAYHHVAQGTANGVGWMATF